MLPGDGSFRLMHMRFSVLHSRNSKPSPIPGTPLFPPELCSFPSSPALQRCRWNPHWEGLCRENLWSSPCGIELFVCLCVGEIKDKRGKFGSLHLGVSAGQKEGPGGGISVRFVHIWHRFQGNRGVQLPRSSLLSC